MLRRKCTLFSGLELPPKHIQPLAFTGRQELSSCYYYKIQLENILGERLSVWGSSPHPLSRLNPSGIPAHYKTLQVYAADTLEGLESNTQISCCQMAIDCSQNQIKNRYVLVLWHVAFKKWISYSPSSMQQWKGITLKSNKAVSFIALLTVQQLYDLSPQLFYLLNVCNQVTRSQT